MIKYYVLVVVLKLAVPVKISPQLSISLPLLIINVNYVLLIVINAKWLPMDKNLVYPILVSMDIDLIFYFLVLINNNILNVLSVMMVQMLQDAQQLIMKNKLLNVKLGQLMTDMTIIIQWEDLLQSLEWIFTLLIQIVTI